MSVNVYMLRNIADPPPELLHSLTPRLPHRGINSQDHHPVLLEGKRLQ